MQPPSWRSIIKVCHLRYCLFNQFERDGMQEMVLVVGNDTSLLYCQCGHWRLSDSKSRQLVVAECHLRYVTSVTCLQ